MLRKPNHLLGQLMVVCLTRVQHVLKTCVQCDMSSTWRTLVEEPGAHLHGPARGGAPWLTGGFAAAVTGSLPLCYRQREERRQHS